jgi:hypothetical protein
MKGEVLFYCPAALPDKRDKIPGAMAVISIKKKPAYRFCPCIFHSIELKRWKRADLPGAL